MGSNPTVATKEGVCVGECGFVVNVVVGVKPLQYMIMRVVVVIVIEYVHLVHV